MNAQEVFDIVVNGLRAQKYERSMDDKGVVCSYRGTNNRKCAAGFILPDEKYNVGLEGGGVDGSCYPVFVGIVGKDNINLLAELQRIHDCSRGVDNKELWEDKWSDIARQYNLRYTPPTE